MMTTPRILLALSTAALLTAAFAPSASAILMSGCDRQPPTFPPEVCERHPCVTLIPSACQWGNDYLQACVDGPLFQLHERIIGCGIP